MKILVIEDKKIHRDSAVQTLAGHEVVIVDSYAKGIEALSTSVDYQLMERLATEAGHGKYPHGSPDEVKSAWQKVENNLREQARNRPDFDAVLVDMMMPMDSDTLAPGVFNYKEQVAYGFVLALRACQVGAKYVAMVTDTNHHKAPLSAALDKLGSAYYSGHEPLFEINGAKALFVHTPFTEKGAGEAKDWGRVLQHLIDGPKQRD